MFNYIDNINDVNLKKIIDEFKEKYYLNHNISLYSILNNIKFKIEKNIIYLYFYSYTSMKLFESIKQDFITYLCNKSCNDNIKILLKVYENNEINKIDNKLNKVDINKLSNENDKILFMIKKLDLHLI